MRSTFALAFVLAFAAADVSATVLYKLTDSRGRVTYVDAVPSGFTGSVQRMDIDTGERVITLDEPAVRQLRSLAENEEIIRRRPPVDPNIEKVRIARLKAAAARAALESAQNNSTPDDWIYYGAGKGRSMRPEYLARIEDLEREVQRTEEEARTAERGF